jgi:hypothetical protein
LSCLNPRSEKVLVFPKMGGKEGKARLIKTGSSLPPKEGRITARLRPLSLVSPITLRVLTVGNIREVNDGAYSQQQSDGAYSQQQSDRARMSDGAYMYCTTPSRLYGDGSNRDFWSMASALPHQFYLYFLPILPRFYKNIDNIKRYSSTYYILAICLTLRTRQDLYLSVVVLCLVRQKSHVYPFSSR